MLFSADTMKYVDSIPHEKEYRNWLSRMSQDETQAVFDKLNEMVDKADMYTSSWMPEADWSNTVFDPVYKKASLC